MSPKPDHNDTILDNWHVLERGLQTYLGKYANVDMMLALKDVCEEPNIKETDVENIAKNHSIAADSAEFEAIIDMWETYNELTNNIKKLSKDRFTDEIMCIDYYLTHLHHSANNDRFPVFCLKAANLALFYDNNQKTFHERETLNALINDQMDKIHFLDNLKNDRSNRKDIIDLCLHLPNINKKQAGLLIKFYSEKMKKLNPDIKICKKEFYKNSQNTIVTPINFNQVWENMQRALQNKIMTLYPMMNIKQAIINDADQLNKLESTPKIKLLNKIKKLVGIINGLDDTHLKELFGKDAIKFRINVKAAVSNKKFLDKHSKSHARSKETPTIEHASATIKR